MDFYEVLDQVVALLRTRGRVTYRALKLQFQLDDEHLEALKEELIQAQRVAADEDGKVLVWIDASLVSGSQFQVSGSQPPAPSTQPPDFGLRTSDSGLSSGERRQLTVMFCDLVGSTALSAQLDPEDLREVVHAYHQTCTRVISRYGGHTAQHLGDGLLVYFGYPAAHEDDAQRAVRTGLEILTGLQPLNAGLQPAIRSRLPHPIQVRIGIHTGLVVVGEVGGGEKREQLALGETPNIAARVQGLAEPDTVVISAATYRLVQGLFECRDLGPHTLKGLSTLLPLYRVVSESEAQSRFEVAVSRGLTPLVGREEELGLLLKRWGQVKDGEGQVVLLSGEPGIGKSRLVQELKERVVREGDTRIEFRCSPYHQNSALYPVLDHLQRVLQFHRDDAPQAKLEKLEKTLTHYRFPQADTVPLLASLLSLPHPEGYPPLTLTPQKQKQKTQEALMGWLFEETARTSVYCAWEDLQWADPSTLEILHLFLDQVPTARMLALLTFRPEFTPPWGTRSYLSQLTLSRLRRAQVGEMVAKVTGGKVLPAEVFQQVVAKTDGVPLFVEELTKMVLESGLYVVGATHASPFPPLAIPATLHDTLMARLDRLATVKEVAQLGATLGREFSYELIQAIFPVDEASLQQALAKLVEAEVLYQRGLPPQTRYLFKHALIQDAAYQSLLKSKRQQYHQRIVQVLEERFPETKETQPELLAHHYTEAGLTAQAIPYWHRAGQRAAQRSANVEAISHLTKGLELLKPLPDTPEHTQQELTLQIALGGPLMASKGYAAQEVEHAYARAWELCRQVGENPQLFPVLFGLWAFYCVRAGHKTAYERGAQLLSLAQSTQDPAFLLEAHRALGITLFYLGEFASAREHLEQAIALYDPQEHRSHAFLYGGYNPKVSCLCYVSWTLWHLGYPALALKRNHEAFTLAQELSHSFSLATTLDFAAWLHQYRREAQAAQEWAEAAVTLTGEQGFSLWLALGTIARGWALAELGQVEGIAQMRQGLAAHGVTGAEFLRPYFFALLADAYAKVGQTEEGFAVLAEALAVVDRTGERFYEAELYRLKGQLTLQKFQVSSSKFQEGPKSEVRSPESEAEECFRKAIDIARHQSAKSLELRAVMSLSRLWQQQGKKKEAHDMLAEIYNWFTEGFDTKDLKEAKALLDEWT